MTDLERFVDLYRSFEIECRVNKKDFGFEIALNSSNFRDEETSSIKFDGYPSFFSTVQFDHDGKFVTQGFWE